jgi:hypothetical protein
VAGHVKSMPHKGSQISSQSPGVEQAKSINIPTPTTCLQEPSGADCITSEINGTSESRLPLSVYS